MSDQAVEWRGVTFAYPSPAGEGVPAIVDAGLQARPGEVLLVVGPSGSGKSTLLRCANGLVPHTSGGRFAGDVVVAGRSTRTHRPRDLATHVGFVHQDPEAQVVVDRVEADVAFVLENLGVDERSMRRRVEEVLDALGIAHLRDRDPATLSGGERQRLAIAGALAAAPGVLVLDEPTSQLDPQGAEDVLAALARLNDDLGTTIVLAEHRLERAAPMADRAVLVRGGRVGAVGDVAAVVAGYEGAPVVTLLGRELGWDPPPLTVRDARRAAGASGALPDAIAAITATGDLPGASSTAGERRASSGDVLVAAEGVAVRLGGRSILGGVDLAVRSGEVVALLGRNGAGKSTLLRTLAGLQPTSRGRVRVAERAAAAYVPQDPGALLFAETVRDEVAHTLRLLGRTDADAVERWLGALGLAAVAERHPRSLSGGERQRVAIAAVAVGGAPVLLLDEPTRGMDAPSRHALERAVRSHATGGGAVVLATHDVELAARSATRVVVLGDGDVVADGPARDVLAGSLFAPQVLRVLPPLLTLDEVRAAIGRST